MKKLNKIKKLNILVIICLSSTIIFAQNELNQKKENRQAQKVAFFTAKMNLNTEESKVFWPVVNEMENELKELKDKNAHGKMMLKDKKIEDFSCILPKLEIQYFNHQFQ